MAFIYLRYLMLLLCLALTVDSKETPTISYISPKVIRDIGTEVELTCAVSDAQGYSVQWVKYDNEDSKDSVPLTTGSNLYSADPRFSIEFHEETGSYALTIRDLRESDDGKYECQVVKNEDKITADVEVKVRTPPTIYNSTRSLATGEGESAELACYASGFPPPKISWRRENNAALPTGASIYRGNVLKIESMQKEYRGTYYCVAENGVGRGARRTINVAVQFAPVVTVRHPRRGQALQNEKYLSCHIDAYPPPAVTWIKDDVQLGISQHYSISNFATEDDSVDTTILVSAIEKQHFGNYTCKAQNKLGTAEGHIELYETATPECSHRCEEDESTEEVQTATSAP